MLWALFLLPVVFSIVYEYPLEDFRKDCKRRDNDGYCDLKCRNFVSNSSEMSDCYGYPMTTVTKTFEFLIYDISFQGILKSKPENRDYYSREWKNQLEMRLRKVMDVEASMLISDKKLSRRGIECYESLLGRCDMQFDFSLTIRSCSDCPSLDLIIESLVVNQDILAEMHVQLVEQNDSLAVTPVAIILIVVFVAAALLGPGLMNVLTTNSRKRKIKSHSTWMIPPAADVQDSQSFPVIVDQKSYAYRQPFQQFHPNQYPYYQLLNSTNTSPNGSIGSVHKYSLNLVRRVAPLPENQDPLVVNKLAEVCQVNDLHRLMSKKFPEEELIAETDRLLLTTGININAVTEREETAVCLAVQENKIQLVAHLLNRGADGNIPDSNGFSLLHHAVLLGHIKILQLLLRKPSLTTLEDETGIRKIDELSNSGKTALMECALYLPEEIGYQMAKMLIGSGASIEVQGDRGYRLNGAEHPGKTVLHYAAEIGNNRIVELVLQEAEKIGSQMVDSGEFNENRTALWFAAKNAHLETVRLLMEAGANQHLPMERSEYPIEVAREQMHHEVVRMLEEFKEKAKSRPLNKQNNYAVRKTNERKRQERILMTPSSTGSSPSSLSRSPQSTTESPPSANVEPSYYSYHPQSYSHWPEGTVI